VKVSGLEISMKVDFGELYLEEYLKCWQAKLESKYAYTSLDSKLKNNKQGFLKRLKKESKSAFLEDRKDFFMKTQELYVLQDDNKKIISLLHPLHFNVLDEESFKKLRIFYQHLCSLNYKLNNMLNDNYLEMNVMYSCVGSELKYLIGLLSELNYFSCSTLEIDFDLTYSSTYYERIKDYQNSYDVLVTAIRKNFNYQEYLFHLKLFLAFKKEGELTRQLLK